MVVNFLKGIEKVSVLRQGWSILKDTNSAASLHALVLTPDSTDSRPLILSRLHIHHKRLEMNKQIGMLIITSL